MIAELRSVTKRYGRVHALDDVSLGLEPGRVTAILGPNGAGKTTAVRLLLGLTRPTVGRVALFGADPRSKEARQRTGVMLQIAKVPETLTVREHVHLFSSYYPGALPVADVLARAGLEALAERRFGALSGGQRQRVLFALAICGDPALLFLDEPTVGLDVESRRAFWQEIRRLADDGRSIVLTTHYLEEADALADRIVVLNQGRVAADGAPHQIKARAASRRIRCVTSLPLDMVAAMEDVHTARRDGAALEILARDAERVVRAMMTLDAHLTGLEVTGAGLEEAFLALTSTSSANAPDDHPVEV
jgi:ABC-2 type transport system ATP-binding protein